jgi:hypothetical protein
MQKLSSRVLGFEQMFYGTFEFNMAWALETILEKIADCVLEFAAAGH